LSTESFVPQGVWVPRAIIGIASRYAVPLYLEIRRHCYDKPECFPGVRRLAQAVGCAIGTVSQLTDEFHALGVIRKLHDGRRCLYRFADGCWRRRKSKKSAHCSVHRTEDMNNIVVPVDKGKNHKPERVSFETRAKRQNLIKTLRRWVNLSPHLPESERPHRLSMLDRAETHLDNWAGRLAEDRRCFELLVMRMRGRPLDAAVVDSLRQRPLRMPALGAFIPAFQRMPV
jgi:hypothetical protein